MAQQRVRYSCIFCQKPVHARHHAVMCDLCSGWQHIKCGNTGITRAEYKKAVDEERDIHFICAPCEVHMPLEQDDELQNTTDHTRDDEAMEVDAEHLSDDNEDPLNGSFTVPDVAESGLDADQSIEIETPAQQEPEIEERSLLEDPLSQTMIEEQPVTYHHLPTGSKFGNPLLVATDGYAYSLLKELKSGGTVWRCSVRSKL